LLSIDGNSVKYLNPDERACSALMKKCLNEPLLGGPGNVIVPSPGISIARASLRDVINSIEGSVVSLHEDGRMFEDHDLFPFESDRITFILSDDMNLTEEEAILVDERSDIKVSIGPKILHTHMSIVIVHNILDRLES
jgi:tRNA (pseudouridine54-N1)-methyltransferase